MENIEMLKREFEEKLAEYNQKASDIEQIRRAKELDYLDQKIKQILACMGGNQNLRSKEMEKMTAKWGDGWIMALERIQDNTSLVNNEYFNILEPGKYYLKWHRDAPPALKELTEAWKRLDKQEQQAFIAGVQAGVQAGFSQDSDPAEIY